MFTQALLKYGTIGAKINLVPGDFSGATLNQGIQERITNVLNDLGELTYGESENSQKQGTMTLQFGKMNKTVMSLLAGHPLETAALTNAAYFRTFKAAATIPAVATGNYGFEMTVDNADGSASYVDATGKTQQLTRQPFTTFVPATVKSYAQGAAGAFKFSTDIIGYEVTPYVPMAIADGDQLDHDPYGLFEVWLKGVIQYKGEKQIYIVKFDQAQLNRQDNSTIDPAQSPISVNFRDLSTNCVLDLAFLNRKVVC